MTDARSAARGYSTLENAEYQVRPFDDRSFAARPITETVKIPQRV